MTVSLPKRFRIVRRLGEGGMGVVYEAFDEERGARIALKTVRDLGPESLARFKHEFRALADVHHPNLVSLGELGSEGDRWFFTMELVEGTDFTMYVAQAADVSRRDAPTVTATNIAKVSRAAPPNDPPLELATTARADHASARPAPNVERGSNRPTAPPPPSTSTPRFDEQKLRSALAQLASALEAIHDAGFIHRDVKPSNVRVTSEGRVVLLDFGLVADASARRSSTEMHMAGTPVYMAPEQATSSTIGPAADWYAVGVLLYEALTGTVPFDGAPLEILMRKQQLEPPAPSASTAGVPPDLDALCTALLRINPAKRPTYAQVMRALGAAHVDKGVSRSSMTYTPPFVGRAAELETLREAFLAHDRGAATLLVRGESGVGKSCLVRRFLEALVKTEPSVVVLAGRCFEREAVPYKAFDGVVDALARKLAHLPEAEATLFLPTRAAPLLQLFPVLRRVAAFARAAHGPMLAVDPLEIRSRAFGALRELFTRLGDAHPLVIVIDDLQWADADSLLLLAELVRPPESPHMLLIGTVRTHGEGATDPARDVLAAIAGEKRVIDLSRLSQEEGRELAEKLLENGPVSSDVSARAIAQEAEGHPLFIDALVRHAATLSGAELTTSGSWGGEAPRLEDALWSRVAALDARAQLVMELLAVTGAPLTTEALVAAAGATPEELARTLSLLRVGQLVSISGVRGGDTVEPYHDRLRVAVLAHVHAVKVTEYHRVLALALEQTGSTDAEAISLHWRGAGEIEQSAKHAIRAAEGATAALAFDRAAKLYEMVLALDVKVDDRRALFEKLGDALANAGRGARAADAYREAAAGAPAARALDLRRRAADQLLGAGHLDLGINAIHTLLASIGVALPKTPLGALFSFLMARLWLRIRGLGFVKRDASQIAAEELTRIDVCWSIAFGFGLVDPVRGASFQQRNLSLALRAGEPFRVARAIAVEAAYVARSGGGKRWRRTEALLKRSFELAEESGEPAAMGQALNSAGIAAYLHGRFRETVDYMKRALDLLQSKCTGVAWEIATARSFLLWASAQLGAIRELRKLQASYLRDAQERGDVYAEVTLSGGDSVLAWLADDDPDLVMRVTRDAMGRWSKQGFHVEHFYELVAMTHASLYAGRADEALTRVRGSWSALRRSLMPQTVQSVRVQSLFCRARSLLAAGIATRDDALLSAASRDARTIARESMPWATPKGALLRAGIESARGRNERAVALLRDAVSGFETAEMALFAAAARRRLADLTGGDEGKKLGATADAYFAAEGVKRVDRMVAMIAPGFTPAR
jgi:serine/threonine protein kinase